MVIVDMRFQSQAITAKGRRYFFDSIECYYDFKKINHTEIKHAWHSNYLQPNEMIEENNAFILRSNLIRSPMGGGLAAFKTENDSKNYLEKSSTK
jgi:copper chaperone NosL